MEAIFSCAVFSPSPGRNRASAWAGPPADIPGPSSAWLVARERGRGMVCLLVNVDGVWWDHAMR